MRMRASWRFVGAALLGVVVASAGAERLAAQRPAAARQDSTVVVRGQIVDSAGVPVAEALVGIAPGGFTRTSSGQGRFEFVLPAPGVYTLRVRRLGYAPASQQLTLAVGETREVSVRLYRFAVMLSPLEVRAARHSKDLVGILHRQSVGLGTVLFGEDLARYNYASLAQALQTPRILQLLPAPRPVSSGSFLRRCTAPRFYIDGKPARTRPMPRLEEVEAIEAHRTIDFIANAAEFTFNDLGSGCPIILIWTKTGLRRDKP